MTRSATALVAAVSFSPSAGADVPDEPSDMFDGTVPERSAPLVLASIVHRSCRLTLIPAS